MPRVHKKGYKPTQATKPDVKTTSGVFTKKRHFQKREDDLESRAALLCRTGRLGISCLITPCPPPPQKKERILEKLNSSRVISIKPNFTACCEFFILTQLARSDLRAWYACGQAWLVPFRFSRHPRS